MSVIGSFPFGPFDRFTKFKSIKGIIGVPFSKNVLGGWGPNPPTVGSPPAGTPLGIPKNHVVSYNPETGEPLKVKRGVDYNYGSRSFVQMIDGKRFVSTWWIRNDFDLNYLIYYFRGKDSYVIRDPQVQLAFNGRIIPLGPIEDKFDLIIYTAVLPHVIKKSDNQFYFRFLAETLQTDPESDFFNQQLAVFESLFNVSTKSIDIHTTVIKVDLKDVAPEGIIIPGYTTEELFTCSLTSDCKKIAVLGSTDIVEFNFNDEGDYLNSNLISVALERYSEQVIQASYNTKEFSNVEPVYTTPPYETVLLYYEYDCLNTVVNEVKRIAFESIIGFGYDKNDVLQIITNHYEMVGPTDYVTTIFYHGITSDSNPPNLDNTATSLYTYYSNTDYGHTDITGIIKVNGTSIGSYSGIRKHFYNLGAIEYLLDGSEYGHVRFRFLDFLNGDYFWTVRTYADWVFQDFQFFYNGSVFLNATQTTDEQDPVGWVYSFRDYETNNLFVSAGWAIDGDAQFYSSENVVKFVDKVQTFDPDTVVYPMSYYG